MAAYILRTRNSDQDAWVNRYEIDDSAGLLDLTGLTAPMVQKLVNDGEAQIECVLLPLSTRKFYIEVQ